MGDRRRKHLLFGQMLLMSCMVDFILPIYFTFVPVRFHLNIDIRGINQMSLRTYMYLTNKDFQLTCWEQKMWLVTSRISKAGERVLSKIFSKKNLKVCVCERENGR